MTLTHVILSALIVSPPLMALCWVVAKVAAWWLDRQTS